MRLKKFLFFATLIWLNSTLLSSQVITLDEIQKKAESNYPAVAQYGIIEKTKDLHREC